MLLIVNPRAAGGRVGRTWSRVVEGLRAAGPALEVVPTTGPGDATNLARMAAATGTRDVGVVGGDGTLNEAVNGLVEDDRLLHDTRLTLLPMGSGSDFARSLDLPQAATAMPVLLASEAFRAVDVGRARFLRPDGTEGVRYFLNILEAGAGGEVMKRVNRSRKLLGARLAYLGAILRTLATYQNPRVRVELDGRLLVEGRLNSVIAANGRHYGRGLLPAPEAEPDDGLLDVVLFGDVGFREALTSMRRLRKGTHLTHPKVSAHRGASLTASSEEEVPIEMDGEVVGRLPMDVRLLPRLLPVRVLP